MSTRILRAASTAVVIGVLGLGWVGATATEGKAARSVKPEAIAKCPTKPGSTSGDYEVVFGRKRTRRPANKLLRKVRRKGFRRAVIEREACIFEVAVIHLTNRQAVRIANNARRLGLRITIKQS